jgi:ribosomal protein L11 methylase PrmA
MALAPVLGPRSWWTASLPCSPAQAEAVATELTAIAFHGFATSSGDDGRASIELWHDRQTLTAAVQAVFTRHRLKAPALVQRSEAAVMADLLPGGRCRLAPGLWLDQEGDLAETPRRMVLRLPPSHAWGDGRHPTTRMLSAMIRRDPPRGPTLDLGCGTGLLGVLAARLGAGPVTFSDIDPLAMTATRAACAVNGVRGRVLRSDLLARVPGTYAVIIANLYADLVLELAAGRRLARALPTGRLLVSGVSAGRWAEVDAALRALGFTRTARRRSGFWTAGEWRR